ncbi:SDR family NAD(P)-dependent oxidoreductase [Chelativorans sp.]|uniref:SDR family NAD(P)-dependent oxidoreductase n=1 Tax=Chelativorans sp. TaxID=2203393 RepID=UPI0035C66E95
MLSHNAGIQRYGTVETTGEALWDEVMSVNLKAAYLVSRAAMPALRKSRGAIVHVSSVQGPASQEGVLAYTTAEHGLIGPRQVHGRRLRALRRAGERRRTGRGEHAHAAGRCEAQRRS